MPRAEFPRARRLTTPADFNRVFQKPIVSSDDCFKVLARANDGGPTRLGMAVSRRVDRRAAGRNRIKRVVRESFRQWSASHTHQLDIVVLPRYNLATICNRRLDRSLQMHWTRLEKRIEG